MSARATLIAGLGLAWVVGACSGTGSEGPAMSGRLTQETASAVSTTEPATTIQEAGHDTASAPDEPVTEAQDASSVTTTALATGDSDGQEQVGSEVAAGDAGDGSGSESPAGEGEDPNGAESVIAPPATNIRFAPGAMSASQSGTVGAGERRIYTVYASEGQRFSATLRAPQSVWLDVRLDHLVLAADAERVQHVDAELPATGPWQVTVISSQEREANYELNVAAPPLPAVAPSPTTTTQRVRLPRPVTPGEDGVVYLTFDDGPHNVYTPQVLDVLARYDARATFFVVGKLAQAHPDIIERIAAEGHTLANHSWNHEDLAKLTREEFDESIGRTEAVLGDLATPCLRPPYASIGASTREWAADHGLTLLTWDGSPQDWLRPPAEEIADYIVQAARPGVVLLMHDGGGDRATTVQGLDMALERLAGTGLRYEPVCR